MDTGGVSFYGEYMFVYEVPTELTCRFLTTGRYGLRESIEAAYIYRLTLLFANPN